MEDIAKSTAGTPIRAFSFAVKYHPVNAKRYMEKMVKNSFIVDYLLDLEARNIQYTQQKTDKIQRSIHKSGRSSQRHTKFHTTYIDCIIK